MPNDATVAVKRLSLDLKAVAMPLPLNIAAQVVIMTMYFSSMFLRKFSMVESMAQFLKTNKSKGKLKKASSGLKGL